MVLCKTIPRSRKKFTHTHTDTLADNCNNNKDKLKVLEHTPYDDYEGYSYHDNNIHIMVKKQRLKTGRGGKQ
jgi:hypothetical protein